MADRGGPVEPDGPGGPNGWYEYGPFTGRVWHNDLGKDLHGDAAQDKASKHIGKVQPTGKGR